MLIQSLKQAPWRQLDSPMLKPSHVKPSILREQLMYPNRGFFSSRHGKQKFTENGAPLTFFGRITLRGYPFPVRLVWTTALSTVFGLGVLLGGVFAWDATTYTERHLDRVPVNALSLAPERGGKKNLKKVEFLLSAEQDPQHLRLQGKPRLVIVGGGWAAIGILNKLKPYDYHVVLVAPENYNLFTPLLPSAAVGTVEIRSLVEPLRRLVARVCGHYLEGTAVDLDFAEKLVEVKSPDGQENFYLPYDKCVIACGSVTSTHGVPGLQNAHHLKTVPDVRNIRHQIIENLEEAALPTVDPEKRKQLLSFVVCGGGPTGVELAAEIYDMLNEDVLNYFPKLLRQEATVSIIQSRDHILNTYSEKISQYAEKKFARNGVDVILNARVKEIKPDSVVYTHKSEDGKVEELSLPAGFTLWSTGIAQAPFTKTVADNLPNQYHKKALEVDSHLRVKGAPLGTVYAVGDAATVETNLTDHLLELVDLCDKDNNGFIDFKEFEHMLSIIRRKFPASENHLSKVRKIFERYDKDTSGELGLNELAVMFQDISSKLTSYPPTAQVASQQGKYLGKKFAALAREADKPSIKAATDVDDEVYQPFKYAHFGSLAYIGNSAAFDFSGYSFAGGLAAMYAWRSVYWSEQVSMRTRVCLLFDWVKRGIFGRDLSKF